MQGGKVPEGMEIVPGNADASGGSTVYYMVRRAAAVSGRDITNARPSVDQNNLPAVSFTLSGEGARKFGTVTETNIGRRLAIILDNRVTSAPTIQSRITDNGQITGVTRDEVNDLSLILKSGALPAKLTYLQEQTIGPTLGADSFRSGLLDAGRHARLGAHRGAVPDPVRHRPDPRLRLHAHHRPGVEPVHVDLRVENAVRMGAVAPRA